MKSETFIKPKLAIVTPMPPERTGIARFSAELIPALLELYDIKIISNQTIVSFDCGFDAGIVCSVDWFEEHAQNFDAIIYHIGNSWHHAYMFDLLKRHPGVVVLHDFYLGNVLHWLEYSEGQSDAFKNALINSHGSEAYAYFECNGASETIKRYPCSIDVLNDAKAVIVNSQFTKELIKKHYGEKLSYKTHVTKLQRVAPESIDRLSARSALGLSNEDVLICVLGFIDPIKLNQRLLDAWTQSSLSSDNLCKLIFVGGAHSEEYARLIEEKIATLDSKERITITGFIDDLSYSNYLSAADIAVQLRDFTRGESSGTILDALSYGIPLIASSVGPAMEFPSGLFIRLDDKFSIYDLVSALEMLRKDENFRHSLSKAGIAYIRESHDFRKIASDYKNIIEGVMNECAIKNYFMRVEKI